MNYKIYNELERIVKVTPSVMNNPLQMKIAIEANFDIDFPIQTFTNLYELSDQIDQLVLARYFGKVWYAETKKYKYSGLAIIDEVNAMNPERVIDVGCGFNEFKGKIQNLVGIDPYNDKADIKSRIEEYETDHEYDVAICLGSINFGSTDKVYGELRKVVDLVKPGGRVYCRVNPGEQHTAPEAKWITFYPWTPEFIMNSATSLGCEVLTLRMDVGNRYYFVLSKAS